MGGRFDDTWLDDSDTDGGEDEFRPADPFEGLTQRDQNLFFLMLDIIPDDKREQAMDYFVDHPQKIKEVVSSIKAKKKIIEDKDAVALRTLFDTYRVRFDEPAPVMSVADDERADNY